MSATPPPLATGVLADGTALHAFYRNVRARQHDGFCVLDGASVALDTGVLGDPTAATPEPTVAAQPGVVLIAGDRYTLAGASATDPIPVTIAPGGGAPRWDLLLAVPDTSAGADPDAATIEVIQGAADTPTVDRQPVSVPDEYPPIQVERPAPPDLATPESGSEGTPLALVWVGDRAETIAETDRYDWRAPPPAVGYGGPDDWLPLGTAGSGGSRSNGLSTTYESVTSITESGVVPGNLPVPVGITEFGVGFSGLISNDTAGETTYVRLRDETAGVALPDTEVSATGTAPTPVVCAPVVYDRHTPWQYGFEMRVSGGTGELTANPAPTLYGRKARYG